MLKIRYFRVELPGGIAGLSEVLSYKHQAQLLRSVKIISTSSRRINLSYAATRQVSIRRILDDGSEISDTVSTVDLYMLSLFSGKKETYLSIIDPPRGARLITNLLDEIFDEAQFFLEPVEFTPQLISKHIRKFDAARLVSAKVRDFAVYEGAVGRLEITSQSGLMPNIAPFLENKFHRVDALTYEISSKFLQGLAFYYRNGTLKLTDPLIDIALPSFEACLE